MMINVKIEGFTIRVSAGLSSLVNGPRDSGVSVWENFYGSYMQLFNSPDLNLVDYYVCRIVERKQGTSKQTHNINDSLKLAS